MSRIWVGFIEEDPISVEDQDHRDAVSQVLAKGWRESDGYVIPPEEERKGFLDDASTYGEITQHGSRQVFRHMKLREPFGETIAFLDLGSGVGRLVAQAYMELPRLVSSIGIELSSTRHDLATQSWEAVKEEANHVRAMKERVVENASLKLVQGDFFGFDITKVTIIYVSSLCFSENMMERLGEKLVCEGSLIQHVATIKRFPSKFETRLGKPEAFFIEMTWSQPQGAQVYFYSPIQKNPKQGY
jgi:hypothetical protein